jgi:hypothetical protein
VFLLLFAINGELFCVTIHQNNHALRFGSLFEFVYFCYRFRVCAITSNTPKGVRRVKDNTSLLYDFKGVVDFLVDVLINKILFLEFF